MWKAALAGALLATTGATLASAQDFATAAVEARSGREGGAIVTEGHIARLKAVLKLTPAQQQYWPAVESALRSFARRQQHGGSDGMVRRAAAAAGDANDARRLVSVARPLVNSLDDKQKQDAMTLAQSLGLGHLASAF